MNFEERIWDFCATHGLLGPGERVVVGVSGGPDSLCLLTVLARLAPANGLAVLVAHFDHGLRPASAGEAGFVQAQAEARGLAFRAGSGATRAVAAARHMSLEAAARELRYDFLAGVARAAGARRVAVAHTADDQAETVIMRFLRGSGLAGLRGMLPLAEVPGHRDLALVRPLLGITRAEVLAYCAEHNLQPLQDESNLDRSFLRNRVRHELLPILEDYNPNIRAVLGRMAAVLAGEHELVRGAVAQLWARLKAQDVPGGVTFGRAEWSALSAAEQRAVLRAAVARLRGAARDIDFAPLEAALDFSRTAQPGRWCDLAVGLRLRVSQRQITVAEAGAPAAALAPDAGPLLQAGGALERGWRFRAEPLEAGEWDWATVTGAGLDRWFVIVDADQVCGPVRLRARLPGDRLQPLGMAGHSSKVSDLMINDKVDAGLRDRWPLVVAATCGGEEAVVWAAGLRLDERFRVTPSTRRVLRLRFERSAGA